MTTLALCVNYYRKQLPNRFGSNEYENEDYIFVRKITLLLSGYFLSNAPGLCYVIYVLALYRYSLSNEVHCMEWMQAIKSGGIFSYLLYSNGIIDFITLSLVDSEFQNFIGRMFQMVRVLILRRGQSHVEQEQADTNRTNSKEMATTEIQSLVERQQLTDEQLQLAR